MCSKSFAALVLVLISTQVVQAQERKYPYEAIVEVEGEYVRSGPALSFYPTDKLHKGDRVTVHRPDPGGWSMISPPKGSFSWIRAEHVQKSGNGSGVLKNNRVVVHVGSSLHEDEITTIQGSLSKQDAVTILDEKLFPFEEGKMLMYKIRPTRHEWRWILTKSIVPADAIRPDLFPGESAPKKKPTGPVAERNAQNERIELDPDAFATSNGIGNSNSAMGKSNSRSQDSRGPASKQPGATVEAASFKSRLDDIDQQFRTMIKQEPSNWSLDEIHDQYSQLENDATLPVQSDLIATRIDAVSRYERTHREYLNFLKVAEEARQRDAKLAAIQQQQESKLRALSGGIADAQSQDSNPQDTQTQTVSSANVSPTEPIPDPIASPPSTSGNPANTRPTPPPFAGAGLVTPMAQTFPGGPQFALIAPGGKLLAYLVPAQGVDLRRLGSQSVGIIGDRTFRQEWGADTIVVRGVQPVQLRANK